MAKPVGAACNLACEYCYYLEKAALYDSEPRTLMSDEVLERYISEYIRSQTTLEVYFTWHGGEPLMRPDLEQCGAAIYAKGFPWGMVTNALAMTEKRYHALRRAGMHSATVSLDGLRDDHNAMRGHAQSFDRATAAIRMMGADKGFVFDVVTCVNRHNLSQLDQIKELLISLGTTRWRLFSIFPSGRAATDADLQLSNEELRQLLDYIARNRKNEQRISLSYGCEGFLGNYEGEVRNHFFACQAGVTVGSVLIDGSISACTSIRSDFHQGNIYQDDFMEVWESRYQPYRDREWMRKGDCADCKYFRYCRGNGMHLRDANGELYFCHLKRLKP